MSTNHTDDSPDVRIREAVRVLSQSDTIHDIAPRLPCTEADPIALLPRAHGADDAAADWVRIHTATDEVDDAHRLNSRATP